MTSTRSELDEYLLWVDEKIQTTKISSELWFRSPSGQRLRANDRFVRTLFAEEVDWAGSDPAPSLELAGWDESQLQNRYWEAAEQTRADAVHFGAAGHRTLDRYFTVNPERSGEAALAHARRTVAAASPAGFLLRTVDRISVSTGASPSQACRNAMIMLSRDWSGLGNARRKPSGSPPRASQLLGDFHGRVPRRTAGRRQKGGASAGSHAGGPSALLTRVEARELSTLYMLGRYPFTANEYRVATELISMPRLRSALLATHLHLTARSVVPLAKLAAEWRTARALLPFTEAFIGRHRPGSPLELSPNPKLITVLCNNIVPAISGELGRRGLSPDELDSDSIRAGIAAAKRRHVFDMMIAMFEEGGESSPDEVLLSGFSMRVCPALAPFSAFLEQWLPYYFDRC